MENEETNVVNVPETPVEQPTPANPVFAERTPAPLPDHEPPAPVESYLAPVVAEPAVVNPEPKPLPTLSDEDRASFRQFVRENIRWIADELWLHQTSVPMDERPIRNP